MDCPSLLGKRVPGRETAQPNGDRRLLGLPDNTDKFEKTYVGMLCGNVGHFTSKRNERVKLPSTGIVARKQST